VICLDLWWDEPAYNAAQATFSERGAFVIRKLAQHDATKLKVAMDDLYSGEQKDHGHHQV